MIKDLNFFFSWLEVMWKALKELCDACMCVSNMCWVLCGVGCHMTRRIISNENYTIF